MQDVKILRMTTGEDVIAKVGENDQGISLKNPFVIIPQQSAPGQPISLMMSLYNCSNTSIRASPPAFKNSAMMPAESHARPL